MKVAKGLADPDFYHLSVKKLLPILPQKNINIKIIQASASPLTLARKYGFREQPANPKPLTKNPCLTWNYRTPSC